LERHLLGENDILVLYIYIYKSGQGFRFLIDDYTLGQHSMTDIFIDTPIIMCSYLQHMASQEILFRLTSWNHIVIENIFIKKKIFVLYKS
jgi:hypothetical protein